LNVQKLNLKKQEKKICGASEPQNTATTKTMQKQNTIKQGKNKEPSYGSSS